MNKHFQAIRGMHDILPERITLWQRIEDTARQILTAYGYCEIRTPLVEMTELFTRSIGEVTDIVTKEMYSFTDRSGENISLRPEGTASCVRAALEHGILQTPQRLWYRGPMFRYERPQRGRYRQFHQIGVEVFGLPGPDIELELILLTARIFKILKLTKIKLIINTLGDIHERLAYRACLVSYLTKHSEQLDADSRARLHTNPLRILDSKHPETQRILADAPTLLEHLGSESQAHFAQLQESLARAGIAYQVDLRLVRGLDYYNRTVFEWITDSLGTQGTICAGGRYDALVEQLGGKPTFAIGCAFGLERLLELQEIIGVPQEAPLDVYLIAVGELAQAAAPLLAERLHDALPTLRLLTHCGGGNFKSQFKRADKQGAAYALVLGEAELERGVIAVKPLREEATQHELNFTELVKFFQKYLTNHRGLTLTTLNF